METKATGGSTAPLKGAKVNERFPGPVEFDSAGTADCGRYCRGCVCRAESAAGLAAFQRFGESQNAIGRHAQDNAGLEQGNTEGCGTRHWLQDDIEKTGAPARR